MEIEGNINYYRSLCTSEEKPDTKYKNVAIIHGYDYLAYGNAGSLYDGPMNDLIEAYKRLSYMGYKVYAYYKKNSSELLELLKTFINAELDSLIFINAGHGNLNTDGENYLSLNKNETTKLRDPCYDYNLHSIISGDERNVKTIYLITDSCHSGTIFNLDDSDKDVYDFVATDDEQIAQQADISYYGRRGYFSLYMWQSLDRGIVNLKDLCEAINTQLSDQVCKYKFDCDHFLNMYTCKIKSDTYTTIPSAISLTKIQTDVQPIKFTVNKDVEIKDKDFTLNINGRIIKYTYTIKKYIFIETRKLIIRHRQGKCELLDREEKAVTDLNFSFNGNEGILKYSYKDKEYELTIKYTNNNISVYYMDTKLVRLNTTKKISPSSIGIKDYNETERGYMEYSRSGTFKQISGDTEDCECILY